MLTLGDVDDIRVVASLLADRQPAAVSTGASSLAQSPGDSRGTAAQIERVDL
jgi:hypothetical protein